MPEIFNFVLYCLIGYIIARAILALFSNSLQEKNEEMLKQMRKISNQFIVVKPEKHGDTIYLFDVVNDQFVAQGRTVEELKIHCKKRYPDKSVMISKDYIQQFTELKDLSS